MMMKSPWVGPDAIEEKVVGIFIVFICSIVFALLLTNVSTLYAQLTTAGAAKRDQIGNIVRFTTFRNVPKAAELKLLKYFDAHYTVSDGQDDVNVLMQMPYQLRVNCVNHIYRDTLLKAPLFSKCTEECAAQLLIQMRPQICLENDDAVVPGQVFDEVFFLMRGALRVSGDPRDSGDTLPGARGMVSKQEGRNSGYNSGSAAAPAMAPAAARAGRSAAMRSRSSSESARASEACPSLASRRGRRTVSRRPRRASCARCRAAR